MKCNLLAFAVPLFLVLMWFEYWFSRRQGRRVHQFEEVVANLNVGIAERLCDLFVTGLFFFVFSWLHEHLALFNIPPTPLTWLLLFLATDLVWYWYHRFGHEVNLLWSVHVVHHQSEDFNYTVSARITVLQAVARGLFWSVLPVIGFQPSMIFVLLLVHGAYPFFTHTQLVGRLGWLEYVIVTPSHHRVHHGSNPQYLDKNYGDVLIIWDKLFGTFKQETETPTYGLTSPLNSYSFLWQHFHFMLELVVCFRRAVGRRQKLRVLFGRPDAIDPTVKSILERKLLRRKKVLEKPPMLLRIIQVQTALTLLILFFTLLLSPLLSQLQTAIAAVFIIISVVHTGAMLEQHRWIFGLDLVRLHLAGLFVFTIFPQQATAGIILSLLFLVVAFYKTLSRHYYALVYAV